MFGLKIVKADVLQNVENEKKRLIESNNLLAEQNSVYSAMIKKLEDENKKLKEELWILNANTSETPAEEVKVDEPIPVRKISPRRKRIGTAEPRKRVKKEN